MPKVSAEDKSQIAYGIESYLSDKYPGIEKDCVGYSVVRKTDGSLMMTLNLVLDDSGPRR